jgi:hypothetical protein
MLGLPQRLTEDDVRLLRPVSETARGQMLTGYLRDWTRLMEDLIKLSSVYHSPRSRAQIKLILRMPEPGS